jgi:galactokinase
VQVVKAFSEAYGLKISTRGLMEYAFRGEQFARSMCGRMDQVCAYGSQVTCMDFDDIIHVSPLKVGCTLHLVIVDLCASKDTSLILNSLQQAYMVNPPPQVCDSSCAIQLTLRPV